MAWRQAVALIERGSSTCKTCYDGGCGEDGECDGDCGDPCSSDYEAPCYVYESTLERSLVKGLTWELRGLVMIMAIGLVFTGNVGTSFMMTLAYMPISVALYFVHERIWKHIGWGHRRRRLYSDERVE
jgi:uncharacterized membrane protein